MLIEEHKPCLARLEKTLGVTLRDPKLYLTALTHRSFLNEYRGDEHLEHNERLEFLGDAVLELVVTDYLYHTFPEKSEGELTAIRSALVNTQALTEVAALLDINDCLLLSRGEAKDTGRARQFILANVVEALIGALYLDQGYEAARKFIERYILPRLERVLRERLWLDAKSYLQEFSQERFNITPTYRVLEATGPDHDRRFLVGAYLGEEEVGRGEGKSKQEAEQQAAHQALQRFGLR